jgi:DNA-binding SARP family transcriptional activator
MTRLAVDLLGSVRIAEGERQLDFAAPPKTLPLLAFLLLNEGMVLERRHIAAALWPTLPASQSRANLRRHLNYIKRALPARQTPWTVGGTKNIAWNPDAGVDVDVTAFVALSSNAATRREAIQLYRGDLCEGMQEPWLQPHRTRLRALLVGNLRHAAESAKQQGDQREVLRLAQQILEHEPLHEEAVCALMQASLSLGDRITAMRTFKTYEERLQTELDLEPTARIRELLDLVRAS